MERDVDTTKKPDQELEIGNEERIDIYKKQQLKKLQGDDQEVIEEQAIDQPAETEHYRNRKIILTL
jgi:hypothetical protein